MLLALQKFFSAQSKSSRYRHFFWCVVLCLGINTNQVNAKTVFDTLLGTYAISIEGKDVPILRITKDGLKFSVFFHGMPDEPDKGWQKISETGIPFLSAELKHGGALVRDIPFPDSIGNLPAGTMCLLVSKFDRLDQGDGSMAIFYIPEDFDYGSIDRSYRIPAGYYVTSDVGTIEQLHKVK